MNNHTHEMIVEAIQQGGGTVVSPPGSSPVRFYVDCDSTLPFKLAKALGDNTAVHYEGENERISPTAGTIVEKIRGPDGALYERVTPHAGFIKTRTYSVICNVEKARDRRSHIQQAS
jgi:hypothetical protein